jgi:hypothetical protein
MRWSRKSFQPRRLTRLALPEHMGQYTIARVPHRNLRPTVPSTGNRRARGRQDDQSTLSRMKTISFTLCRNL